MAVFNLAITIPDAELARVRAALRELWGTNLTDAQVTERIRTETRDRIKAWVVEAERRILERNATASIVPPDAT